MFTIESKIHRQKMSDVHDDGPCGAGRDSAAHYEAMEKTFYLAVDVQVHASSAKLREMLRNNILCMNQQP